MEDKNADHGIMAAVQRQELMAATQAETDLAIAFRLQVEEAMSASLALYPSPSASPLRRQPRSPAGDGDEDVALPFRLQDMELQRFQQELEDSELCRAEMRRVTEDLRRNAHDERFARDLLDIPEDEWEDTGDWFQRPIGDGLVEGEEPFRLFFKGLGESVGVRGEFVSAVGVAICDPLNELVLKIQKPNVGPKVGREIMETRALIEGLQAALSIGIKKLDIFFHHTVLYNHITRRWTVKQRKVLEMINEANYLQSKIEKCRMLLLPRREIQFVFKLAKDAIDSHLVRTAEFRGKTLKETCNICFEDTDLSQIFEIDDCSHRFCFSCMKQHVEVKLFHGNIPACPHDGCNTRLKVESSKKFLTAKLLDIMAQRIEEASVSPSEKVYCPYPKCSALMSRSKTVHPDEGSSSRQIPNNELGLRKCIKCYGLFCITCKVPWHVGMSCNDYKRCNPYPPVDNGLRFLANHNMWRQCAKCNHMIELASGCFHLTCRCGYEFCYTCGAEWKNKVATCSCPLWEEDNILDEDDDYISSDEEDYIADEEEDYETEDSFGYEEEDNASEAQEGEPEGSSGHDDEDPDYEAQEDRPEDSSGHDDEDHDHEPQEDKPEDSFGPEEERLQDEREQELDDLDYEEELQRCEAEQDYLDQFTDDWFDYEEFYRGNEEEEYETEDFVDFEEGNRDNEEEDDEPKDLVDYEAGSHYFEEEDEQDDSMDCDEDYGDLESSYGDDCGYAF